MAQDNQGNQGFVIPSASPSTPIAPTGTEGVKAVDVLIPQGPESDTGTQTYAIAGVVLLIWVISAFFFRRKWAVSYKERRVSESNAEASGWAFFGALTSLGVGAVAAFFDKFATLIYLGPLVGVAIILFALAFFMARK